MTNYIVLDGWVYVALLSTIGLVGVYFVLQGLWMEKMYKETRRIVGGMGCLSSDLKELIIMRTGNSHNSLTTRLIYLKGQLDRVLNEQPVAHNERMAIKKETQEIKTRLTWSKKREVKDLKVETKKKK